MDGIKASIRRNEFRNRAFTVIGILSTLIGLFLLAVLLIDLAIDGMPRLSYKFLTSFPSRFPEEAGILSALVGSFLILLVTAASAIPLGIAAGIYLEEYAGKNWLTDIIEINIANLAGVPSIVYGLLALGLFVQILKLGESILTGGLTLGLLILPMVIMATRESIRSIPNSIREASYALGATKWQTVKHHIVPYSTGGILTGVIIGLSRAIGETAPLITVGALTFIAFLPSSPLSSDFPYFSFKWLLDPFTVLPIQMFNWVSRPQHAFQLNAAAAGIILMLMTLLMNGLAIYIRYKYRKKIKW
ncbi:MAG TPA: phosphate ABC transporter permease PstA [Syntrophales bacterium]|nr:phosphate ABC transporter permease PstA [Syntrophales bacterium]